MTRKKVKLVWIANDAARKASLKKRRAGLLKKVSELTTLCGVKAFVIIYSPDDPEPAVWPSRPVVEELLHRFQSLPDMERTKKMTNQESYLKERMSKLQDQGKKHEKKNMDLELSYLMHQLYQGRGAHGLSYSELEGLTWLIQEKVKDIRKRVEYFEQVPPFSSDFFPNRDPMIGGDADDVNGESNPIDAIPTFPDQWLIDAMKHKDSSIGAGSSTRSDIGLPHPYTSDGATFSVGTDLSFFRRSNVGGSIAGHGFGLGVPHHPNFGGHSGANHYDLGLAPGNMVGGAPDVNYFDAGLPHGNMGGNNSGGNNFNLEFPQGNNFDLGPNHQNIGENAQGLGRPHGNIAAKATGSNTFHGLGLPHGNFARSNIGGHGFSALGFTDHGHPGSSGAGGSGAGAGGSGAGAGAGASDAGLHGFFGTGNDDRMASDVTKNWPPSDFPH